MSDLSWLNPTPHAIAVYASQPLSPVATQHSLPSRTLPFTWAGLSPAGSHQLCLAHSLDHLVGEQLHRVRHFEADGSGRLEIDDELELAGLQHRQVGGLGALEDVRGVSADLMKHGRNVGAITHQQASFGQVA